MSDYRTWDLAYVALGYIFFWYIYVGSF